MGFVSDAISDIGGIIEAPFRTGATSAARDATERGEAQLGRQEELLSSVQGDFQPIINRGEQANQNLFNYYNGDQQAIVDTARNNEFYDHNIQVGEEAIARNRQATGGFRSGTTQENLAQNSQNVLQGLVQQILQGQASFGNVGANAVSDFSAQSNNILNGIGSTSGAIATGNINEAARRGAVNNQILGGIGQIASTAFSDRRLKENITRIGSKNDLPWYSWEWNTDAGALGLTGSDVGHIADEVKAVRPDLVIEKDGYDTVNYGGF